MTAAAAQVGNVFLVLGLVAGLVGVVLMYTAVDDEERNDRGWFFKDRERTEDNIATYEAGRITATVGLLVMLVGGVVSIVGRDVHHS